MHINKSAFRDPLSPEKFLNQNQSNKTITKESEKIKSNRINQPASPNANIALQAHQLKQNALKKTSGRITKGEENRKRMAEIKKGKVSVNNNLTIDNRLTVTERIKEAEASAVCNATQTPTKRPNSQTPQRSRLLK